MGRTLRRNGSTPSRRATSRGRAAALIQAVTVVAESRSPPSHARTGPRRRRATRVVKRFSTNISACETATMRRKSPLDMSV